MLDTKAVQDTIIRRISDALRMWEAQQEDHDVPSPSGIHRCFRDQWAKATKQKITNPDQLAWIKNMEQGKLVEPFWSDIFRLADFTVADLNERLTIAGGPMTGVGDRMVTDNTGEINIPLLLELKNLGPFSYYEFLKFGLRNGAPGYYYQVQSYMEMYNIPLAVVFAGQAEASSITWWWRVREKKQSGPDATEWPPPFIVEVVERAPADFAWAQQRAVDVRWYSDNVTDMAKVPRDYDPVEQKKYETPDGRKKQVPCIYCPIRDACIKAGEKL